MTNRLGEGKPGATSLADGPLLPMNACFKGRLVFLGDAVLDGLLKGNVWGRGTLLIGPAGRVEGHVVVDELVVRGAVEGDVHARVRVEMCAGSRVTGCVEAPVLSVEEGARFEGPCRVSSLEKSEARRIARRGGA